MPDLPFETEVARLQTLLDRLGSALLAIQGVVGYAVGPANDESRSNGESRRVMITLFVDEPSHIATAQLAGSRLLGESVCAIAAGVMRPSAQAQLA